MTAVLVAHDAGAYLDRTLDALAAQTRLPDQLLIVDVGSAERLTEIPGSVPDTQLVRASPNLSFGEAVLTATRLTAPAADENEWLWLLSADNAPEPGALAAMLGAVEISPSVAVAGPKLMQWADSDYLSSFGESLTAFGTTVELAEPLLDQAQYDRESDVLAVAAPGMLVRHRLWDELGGFDPALPAVDDALDFCVRARLAGHRVSLVPEARILSAGRRAPGTAVLGPKASRGRRAQLARTAQLHRRLAYAPTLAVPLHWLSLLPFALLRAIGQLLRKQPGSVIGEFAAAFTVAFGHVGSVAASRRAIARARKVGWSAIAPLRMPWPEIRRRRALAREDATVARGAGTVPVRFFSGGGAYVVLAALVAGLALHLPLFGAAAVAAPGLLPLGDLGSLWGQVGYGWHPLGAGFVGAGDPFAWLLALLGTATFWSPSTSIVALYVLAFPLAAGAAWLGAARLTANGWLRFLAAVAWTLAPDFLVALNEGRLAAVLAHLLLPWLLFTMVLARRSWAAAATSSLIAAGVVASAPSLAPALLVFGIAAVVLSASSGRATRGWHRLLLLPVPALVLFAPLVVQQTLRGTPLAVLADPGLVLLPSGADALASSPFGRLATLLAGTPDAAAAGWGAAAGQLGWSGGLGLLLAAALLAPMLVLALAAPFRVASGSVFAALTAAGLGFLTALVAGAVHVASSGGVAVPLWAGPGFSFAWGGVIAAAVLGLSAGSAPRARAFRVSAAAVAGLAVVAAALPLAWPAMVDGNAPTPGPLRTLPALVAAEARTDPSIGTLVLSPAGESGIAAAIERGAGARLEDASTLYSTARVDDALGADLTALAANLASRGGFDPTPVLAEQRIGFVLLTPGRGDGRAMNERAAAALDGNPLFTSVTETADGRLWRYTGLDAGLPVAAPVGPSNVGTGIGIFVLLLQAILLLGTLLLALPTGGAADRLRPEREARRGSGLPTRAGGAPTTGPIAVVTGPTRIVPAEVSAPDSALALTGRSTSNG